MKVAVLVQPGFGSKPDSSCGLWAPYTRLKNQYPNAMVEILAHDDPVESIIPAMLPFDYWIHWGHSFGTGHGLVRAAAAAWQHHRYFDLAICVDPVPFSGQHFIPTEQPFPHFPENVLEVLSIRTLNKNGLWAPWGRAVSHPNVAGVIVFGSTPMAPPLFAQPTEYIESPTTHHDNIDSETIGHERGYALIDERIAA